MTARPTIRCPEPRDDRGTRQRLVDATLGSRAITDADDPDPGRSGEGVDMPTPRFVPATMPSHPGRHPAASAACVHVITRHQLMTRPATQTDAGGTANAEEQLVGHTTGRNRVPRGLPAPPGAQ